MILIRCTSSTFKQAARKLTGIIKLQRIKNMAEAVSSLLPGFVTPTTNSNGAVSGDKRQCEEEAGNPVKKQKTEDLSETAAEKVNRKKVVMLLVYCGKGYLGMQRNPGAKTIESDLMEALLKAQLASKEHIDNPSRKLSSELQRGLTARMQHLPEHTSICYQHMLSLPVKRLLMFCGLSVCSSKIQNHRKPSDPSAKRYIMEFSMGSPFVRKEVQFALISVKGQSFMLHQIRKMIAPGLGLMLDRVHYDYYNKRFGDDGMHEPILWEKYESEINRFKEDYIYPTIIDTEIEERSYPLVLELHSDSSADCEDVQPSMQSPDHGHKEGTVADCTSHTENSNPEPEVLDRPPSPSVTDGQSSKTSDTGTSYRPVKPDCATNKPPVGSEPTQDCDKFPVLESARIGENADTQADPSTPNQSTS
ncbi:hypothetical protein LSH36_550g02015 [Paralvinella palmiformis]|uniref:Pseudouridine synthase I TruA alpha/beta domain-containing protein n=1 Tax=Paralvinella palmiformis TaxID=53620 RepID=A0AAD9J866_9ANNE|nr:hypothetical protein LSH36_550g02015 [Paralvinella palmiformis]